MRAAFVFVLSPPTSSGSIAGGASVDCGWGVVQVDAEVEVVDAGSAVLGGRGLAGGDVGWSREQASSVVWMACVLLVLCVLRVL